LIRNISIIYFRLPANALAFSLLNKIVLLAPPEFSFCSQIKIADGLTLQLGSTPIVIVRILPPFKIKNRKLTGPIDAD
jgi:hypothetical protein